MNTNSLALTLAGDTWRALGATEAWEARSPLGRGGQASAVLLVALPALLWDLAWAAAGHAAQAYGWAHARIPGVGLLLGLGVDLWVLRGVHLAPSPAAAASAAALLGLGALLASPFTLTDRLVARANGLFLMGALLLGAGLALGVVRG